MSAFKPSIAASFNPAAALAGTSQRKVKPENRSADDEVKADAYINLVHLVAKNGDLVPLVNIDSRFGIRVYEDAGSLPARLIELARANGGKLEVTLKAVININSAKEAESVDYSTTEF